MKWFKHDSDSSRESNLKKLLMRYGAVGYGLYWYCLELIAGTIDKTNLTFELKHDCEILAHDLKLDQLKVEEMMKFMIDLKLFEMSVVTQKITCLQLARKIENSIVKSPQLKQIQSILKSQTIPDNPRLIGTRQEKSGSEQEMDKSPQLKQIQGILKSQTIPDNPRHIGTSQEKSGLELELELDKDISSSSSNQQKIKMTTSWNPSESIFPEISEEFDIPDKFSREQVSGFRRYWFAQDHQGQFGWDAKFIEHVKKLWKRKS